MDERTLVAAPRAALRQAKEPILPETGWLHATKSGFAVGVRYARGAGRGLASDGVDALSVLAVTQLAGAARRVLTGKALYTSAGVLVAELGASAVGAVVGFRAALAGAAVADGGGCGAVEVVAALDAGVGLGAEALGAVIVDGALDAGALVAALLLRGAGAACVAGAAFAPLAAGGALAAGAGAVLAGEGLLAAFEAIGAASGGGCEGSSEEAESPECFRVHRQGSC